MVSDVASPRVVFPLTVKSDERVAAPVKVVTPVTARVEESTVAPVNVVAPDTVNVPVMDGESFKEIDFDSPKAISPPPVRLLPAVMVIFALVKVELGILVIVFEEPEIVLFVIV